MKPRHSTYAAYIGLGLCFLANACREPAQFRELPVGGPVYQNLEPEEQNPEQQEPKTPEETPTTSATDKTTTAPDPDPNDQDLPTGNNSVNQSTDPNGKTDPNPPSPLFSDCDQSPDKAIVAELYSLPENTSSLPDFQSMSALRTVCLSQLNIAKRQFSEGFPGVEDLFEWFALDMRFELTVPSNGNYTFSLAADDGAKLWIDGEQKIDNDGLHEVATVSATTYLSKGKHSFRVAYFQGPRYHIALELFWKVPGSSSKSYIPVSAISRVAE